MLFVIIQKSFHEWNFKIELRTFPKKKFFELNILLLKLIFNV